MKLLLHAIYKKVRCFWEAIFMKSVILFLCVNFSVMLLFGVLLNIVGFSFENVLKLMIVSGFFGIGGSLLSLYLSKFLALSVVRGKIINTPSNDLENWLVQVICNQSRSLNIIAPQLVIYDDENMNAFATGYNRNKSLIAFSTGLLKNMSKKSIEAVVAHEMNHIVTGDMVTMTLIQGVINTFVIYVSRIIVQLVCSGKSFFSNNDDDYVKESNASSLFGENSNLVEYIILFILELLFGLLANIIVLWFSRNREFYADAGAAKLVGCANMISALKELQCNFISSSSELSLNDIKTFCITVIKFSRNNNILDYLFSSHPTIEKRIEALKNSTYL